MNEKERKPLHNIPPNLYPTLSTSLDSYKVEFFYLFPIRSSGILFYIFYNFILNLSHLFRLFTATLFSKCLILLISFKELVKHKNPYFIALYVPNLNKSNA